MTGKKSSEEYVKRQLAYFKAKQTMKPKRKRKGPERDENQIRMDKFAE